MRLRAVGPSSRARHPPEACSLNSSIHLDRVPTSTRLLVGIAGLYALTLYPRITRPVERRYGLGLRSRPSRLRRAPQGQPSLPDRSTLSGRERLVAPVLSDAAGPTSLRRRTAQGRLSSLVVGRLAGSHAVIRRQTMSPPPSQQHVDVTSEDMLLKLLRNDGALHGVMGWESRLRRSRVACQVQVHQLHVREALCEGSLGRR